MDLGAQNWRAVLWHRYNKTSRVDSSSQDTSNQQTTLVSKELIDRHRWHASSYAWSGSEVQTFLNTTFKNQMSSDSKSKLIGEIFIPSKAQMEGGWNYFNSNARRVATIGGTNWHYWTSSPRDDSSLFFVYNDGSIGLYSYSVDYDNHGVRPAITLPSTQQHTNNQIL